MNGKRRAVFLDRDGVLNQLVLRGDKYLSPQRMEDFMLFPWTKEALEMFASAGFVLVVVTNQPDIARGFMNIAELEKMHASLRDNTPIEHIYVCPHDSVDRCTCRKPRPGLLLKATQELGLDASVSWVVGDRSTDIEAGRNVGAQLIHVDCGQENTVDGSDVIRLPNLKSAATYILDQIHFHSQADCG